MKTYYSSRMFGFHIVGRLLPGGLFEALFGHFDPGKKKKKKSWYKWSVFLSKHAHSHCWNLLFHHQKKTHHKIKIPAWNIQTMVMRYLDTMISVCQTASPHSLKWLSLVYYCMTRASRVAAHLCCEGPVLRTACYFIFNAFEGKTSIILTLASF